MAQNRALIVGLCLITLCVGIYLWLRYLERSAIDWNETFTTSDQSTSDASKHPYGLYVIERLLNGYFPNSRFERIEQKISFNLPEKAQNASYIFISNGMKWDSLDVERLASFVEQGNDAFISSTILSKRLVQKILGSYNKTSVASDYNYINLRDSIATLAFEGQGINNKQFTCEYLWENKKQNSYWYYFDTGRTSQQTTTYSPLSNYLSIATQLGTVHKNPNFIEIPYQKGRFLLHTTPLAFSNVSLLKKELLDYTSLTFSHLNPNTTTLYWDASNHVQAMLTEAENGFHDGESRHRSTALAYILKQPALRYAWYLLCLGVILYLIFRAKRRQRIIPVLPMPSNTSLEFIKTISIMHFMRRDHKAMALQQSRSFLSHVRERYKLPTTTLDEGFVLQLAQRAKVEKSSIETILEAINNVERKRYISEDDLIAHYKVFAQFYKNT